ncbi:MAG: hypothetical protein ACT6FB_02195 [Methanosarcinaceae archaeon]
MKEGLNSYEKPLIETKKKSNAPLWLIFVAMFHLSKIYQKVPKVPKINQNYSKQPTNLPSF